MDVLDGAMGGGRKEQGGIPHLKECNGDSALNECGGGVREVAVQPFYCCSAKHYGSHTNTSDQYQFCSLDVEAVRGKCGGLDV